MRPVLPGHRLICFKAPSWVKRGGGTAEHQADLLNGNFQLQPYAIDFKFGVTDQDRVISSSGRLLNPILNPSFFTLIRSPTGATRFKTSLFPVRSAFLCMAETNVSVLHPEWPRRRPGIRCPSIRAHARGARLPCEKSQHASVPSRPAAMRWPLCLRRPQLHNRHERLAGTAPQAIANRRKALWSFTFLRLEN
jgi:hypothetical protein